MPALSVLPRHSDFGIIDNDHSDIHTIDELGIDTTNQSVLGGHSSRVGRFRKRQFRKKRSAVGALLSVPAGPGGFQGLWRAEELGNGNEGCGVEVVDSLPPVAERHF